MIFLGTYTLPGSKTDEWTKCSIKFFDRIRDIYRMVDQA